MNAPVFISGLRKSGTSLVKSLLDGHPDLFVYPPNELHLFRYSDHPALVKDKLARYKQPARLLQAVAKTPFVRRMADRTSSFYLPEFDSNLFDRQINRQIDPHKPIRLHEVFTGLMQAMYQAIYKQSMPDRLRGVSKSVLETEYFPEIRQMFPDSRFIYVLRNPYAHFVSAVRSMRTHTGKANKRDGYEGMTLKALTHPYPFLGPELKRMEHSYYFMQKYARLYPDRFYVLVYDDLIADPRREMERLCRFLDLRFDEVLLRPTLMERPWKGNSWFNGDFEGIDRRPLEQWKQHIRAGEIRLVNRHFNRLIQDYFELLETSGSIWAPFHRSEYKPWVYLANRLLYFL